MSETTFDVLTADGKVLFAKFTVAARTFAEDFADLRDAAVRAATEKVRADIQREYAEHPMTCVSCAQRISRGGTPSPLSEAEVRYEPMTASELRGANAVAGWRIIKGGVEVESVCWYPDGIGVQGAMDHVADALLRHTLALRAPDQRGVREAVMRLPSVDGIPHVKGPHVSREAVLALLPPLPPEEPRVPAAVTDPRFRCDLCGGSVEGAEWYSPQSDKARHLHTPDCIKHLRAALARFVGEEGR